MIRGAWLAAAALFASPAHADEIVVPGGTELELVTVDALSSKSANVGDPVTLAVRDDVKVGGRTVIAAGTRAVGQVSEARGTGGFGVNGRLVIAPLYITAGGATVRLVGGRQASGRTDAGTVAGLLVSGLISGRSAQIPAGAVLPARVLRDVRLAVSTQAAPAPKP